MKRDISPIHPGEVLKEDFLDPLEITQYQLAKATNMPQDRVSHIVRGNRAITADTALRLGRFFGVEPQFWLNLQSRYDLETAEDVLAGRLEQEVTPFKNLTR